MQSVYRSVAVDTVALRVECRSARIRCSDQLRQAAGTLTLYLFFKSCTLANSITRVSVFSSTVSPRYARISTAQSHNMRKGNVNGICAHILQVRFQLLLSPVRWIAFSLFFVVVLSRSRTTLPLLLISTLLTLTLLTRPWIPLLLRLLVPRHTLSSVDRPSPKDHDKDCNSNDKVLGGHDDGFALLRTAV